MMTHEYRITGMTCNHCVNTVQTALSLVPGIKKVDVKLPSKAIIEMDRHIDTATLQQALKGNREFRIEELNREQAFGHSKDETGASGFFTTYKPILLVFAFISGITLLIEISAPMMDWMRAMRHFMAGFFIVFSFFKMLDLKAFAASYSMYDLIAMKWPGWGYVYAFAELAFGIGYMMNINPVLLNLAVFIVMSISTAGVIQSLRKKRKIKCACLGAVFNLPMSTITLTEDVLMVAMAGTMLVHFIVT